MVHFIRLPTIRHKRVSNTDQQFNDITLKSQNALVIRSTPNMSSHMEDQSKINESTISKLKNYVDQKFNEAAMKYLKENILPVITQ